jgi:hypothetical protein
MLSIWRSTPQPCGKTYGLVRISRIYRGRAVPIVWKVRQYPSSSVAYLVYADVLDMAASLLPFHCKVILLAD